MGTDTGNEWSVDVGVDMATGWRIPSSRSNGDSKMFKKPKNP